MTVREALVIMQRAQLQMLQLHQLLDLINLQEGDKMVDPAVAAIIQEFNVETDAVAARIQRLIDGGALSADSKAALEVVVTRLHALGQDPANPIP